MIVVSTLAWAGLPEAHDPTYPLFWFRMSLALMFGFIVAYPMNWWLVSNHLKHGMMTVRPQHQAADQANQGGMQMTGMDMANMAMAEGGPANKETVPSIALMTAASVAVLAAGLIISWLFGGLGGG